MQLSLQLLGPFRTAVAGQSIPESRTKKIEALLIYLVMESNQAHRREKLVGLLFPEQPDEVARTNLRQTLTRLRKSIQDKVATPPFLLVTRESTQFNRASDHVLDVTVFQQALRGCPQHQDQRNGRCADCMHLLRTGIELYRGPFLDGFFLEDSAQFGEWVRTYRERFQQAMLVGLQQLADYYKRRGEYATATTYARRHIEIEPWDEAAQRQVMRLLAYQGQRNAALKQYAFVQTMLQDELGVDPTPETATLRDRIATAGDGRPYRLPPREQTIIGRDDELADIHQQLSDPEQRLCTLVGPGGIGKTRLALETGWRVATNYMGPFLHGVYFVPLAGVTTATEQPFSVLMTHLITAVADSMNFTFSGPQPPQQQLIQYLHHKSVLLILDNCEHLVAAVREFSHALLAGTEGVNLLVTSRERLNMAAEWPLSIDGLSFPAQTAVSAELAQLSAIQLFMQRARRVDLHFEADDGNGRCTLTTIGRICRLVQGIPLAIELAAPWVRMLTCAEIAHEIEQNLDALTTSMAHVLPRHRSMRAVFDHSWALLPANEQQTVARLSVFRGGFDRQAVKQIAGATMAQLAVLLDKSLLRRLDGNGGPARYQMQEVLRQYAAEKLRETEEETAVFLQHSRYYLNLVAQQSGNLRGRQQPQALAEIRQEIENIRAAWQYALAHEQFDVIDMAADTLALFYYMRSWSVEGDNLFTEAVMRLQQATETSHQLQTAVTLGKLLARQGWFIFLQGRHDAAQSTLQKSLDILRKANTKADLVYTLDYLAVITYTLGHYEQATQLATEGLVISRELADPYRVAVANNILSQVAFLQGKYEIARQSCEASLAIERKIGNRWSMGFSLTNLGRVSYAQGDYERARTYYLESLAIRQAMHDQRGQAICLNYLGDAAKASGNLGEAVRQYKASLAIAKEIGDLSSVAISLTRLGFTCQEQQRDKEARLYFCGALQQAQAIPQQLDALVGMAMLLAQTEPALAYKLVVKIGDHQAATTETRQLAVSLRQQLPSVEEDVEVTLEGLIDAVVCLEMDRQQRIGKGAN